MKRKKLLKRLPIVILAIEAIKAIIELLNQIL